MSDYASLNSQKTKQHSDELKNLLKDSDELARSSTARWAENTKTSPSLINAN